MSSTAVTEKKPRLTTSAMIASIASEGQRVKAAPFGKALVEYAATRPEVVGLSADLAKYTDLHLFAQAYPERFFQMGMAEQLLMGAAGGMAKEGLVPFATTYAVFGTRRAYDFIHQVIAEENLNVKICCALPGLTTGYGPSHQATEDLAMMRGVPGLTIVLAIDTDGWRNAVPQIAAHKGPVYMRLLRGSVPLVLDEIEGYRFELGKAKLLREGADVLVISSGILTMRALEAAQDLAKDKVGVAVLHCPTIKPLDEAAIVEAVRYRHRLVVVAENHSVVGGLGEAVASTLLRHRVQPAGFQLAGLPDAFLDAGALPTLHDRYGISRGAPRVLRLLEQHRIPATFTACALALERAPELAREIVRQGHEVTSHGWRWAHQFQMNEDDERAYIRRAADSLERTTGRRPQGWLSRYLLTPHTRRLLVEEGFLYHMDDYGDDEPSWDAAHGRPIVVLPYQLDNNDMKMWVAPAMQPWDWARYAIETLDWLSREPGPRMASIGLHLRIVGRPGRIGALEQILDHVSKMPNVWVASRAKIAAAFAAAVAPPS